MDDTTLSPDQVRDELVRRKVRLYHAIDLPDFETYCNEWALLSRQQLEVCGGIKVPFYTDSSDKEKQLFDRCFGNLTHFWKLFWELPWGLPNAYGLVTLVFQPEVFTVCSDVAITSVGANTKGFDLNGSRIADGLRLGTALAGDTPSEPKGFVEFSTGTNRLPFDWLERVVVQPVEVEERTLLAAVDALVARAAGERQRPPVVEEPAAAGREPQRERLRELLSWATLRKGEVKPWEVADSLPEALKGWFNGLTSSGPLVPFCHRAFATLERLPKIVL